MKISINYLNKVQTIKNRFNKVFPFLKLEFSTRRHKAGGATPKHALVNGKMILGEINGVMKEGIISIEPGDTVKKLEQTLQKKFGLSAQVFRKQKEVWIETTRTDNLTLDEQNQKGRDAALQVRMPAAAKDRYLEDGQYR